MQSFPFLCVIHLIISIMCFWRIGKVIRKKRKNHGNSKEP